MDDMLAMAPSDGECWQATSWVSFMCNRLGIQHAARKQRGPITTKGPWVGSMIFSHQEDELRVFITQENWHQMKRLLAAIVMELTEGEWLDFQSMESTRGFLIYLSITYNPMIPFLLGIC
jgi:hypothetical protein